MENFLRILLAALIVLLFIGFIYAAFPPISKQKIADDYGVSRKTLNNWVQTFCRDINYTTWKSKRKIDTQMQFKLFASLGPIDKSMTVSKKQLLDKCSIDYKSLCKEAIRKGILPKGDYTKMRIFPPSIAQQLLTV